VLRRGQSEDVLGRLTDKAVPERGPLEKPGNQLIDQDCAASPARQGEQG